MVRGETWPRLLLLGGAVTLAACILTVAADPAATGYETTTYAAYPAVFWVALLGAAVVGQVLLVRAAMAEDYPVDWRAGFGLLVAAVAVLLFVPYVRYGFYVPGKGDVLTFVGTIRSIVASGRIPPTDYYPGAHVQATALSYATGLPVTDVVTFLPPLVTLFYVASVYYLFGALFPGRRAVRATMAVAALPLLGYETIMFSPSIYGFALVPFVLLLFFTARTERTPGVDLLLVVSVAGVVFIHPFATLSLVFLFVLSRLPALLAPSAPVLWRRTPWLEVGGLAFVLFFVWYYSFEAIVGSTSLTIQRALGISASVGGGGSIRSPFAAGAAPLADLLRVAVYQYGLAAALFALGTFFLGYFLLRGVEGGDRRSALLYVAAAFAIFVPASLVALVADVTVGFTRVSRYVRLVAPAILGLGLVVLSDRVAGADVRGPAVGGAVALVVVLAFLSGFGLYGNPMAHSMNGQITDAEIQGMRFTFTHRDPADPIDELGTKQGRFHSLFYGGQRYARNVRMRGTTPPERLDYDNPTAVSQLETPNASTRYLLVTDFGRRKFAAFYPGYREHLPFRPGDPQRLAREADVDHVYDNGEFDVYTVRNPGANGTDAGANRTGGPNGTNA